MTLTQKLRDRYAGHDPAVVDLCDEFEKVVMLVATAIRAGQRDIREAKEILTAFQEEHDRLTGVLVAWAEATRERNRADMGDPTDPIVMKAFAEADENLGKCRAAAYAEAVRLAAEAKAT